MPTRRPRFTTLLAASAMGIYLLVVGGTTAAVADTARACSAWPVCVGPALGDTTLLVAWAHRLLALVVGVLVLATVIASVRSAASRRVTGALALGAVLYPVQIGVGALVATTGTTGRLPTVHLGIGMAIFVALVGALAWQLEAETGTDDEAAPGTDAAADANVADATVTEAAVAGDTGDAVADDATAGDDAAEDAVATADDAPSTAATDDRSAARRVLATGAAYARLTKPRLMWLLCLVAAAGMALAAGPALEPSTVLFTLGGGVLAIGASGTFNHVLERDADRRMDRTSDRPMATHRIPVERALAFGAVLTVASLSLFWQVNALAAALGLSAILFYSVVYTVVLKPNTVQNTVIGGFAGSLPALIGWVAVTDGFGLPGLALAGVIFLWTPAHFYNLALAYKDDYAKGGFPMMPVVRGETETRKHILYYLGATLVAAGAMAVLTSLGPLYAVTTATFGAVFLWAVVRLHRERSERAAFRAFHASNAYLGAVLLAVVVDAIAL